MIYALSVLLTYYAEYKTFCARSQGTPIWCWFINCIASWIYSIVMLLITKRFYPKLYVTIQSLCNTCWTSPIYIQTQATKSDNYWSPFDVVTPNNKCPDWCSAAESTSVKNTVHKTSDGSIHVTQLDMIGCDLPAVVKLWWKNRLDPDCACLCVSELVYERQTEAVITKRWKQHKT